MMLIMREVQAVWYGATTWWGGQGERPGEGLGIGLGRAGERPGEGRERCKGRAGEMQGKGWGRV